MELFDKIQESTQYIQKVSKVKKIDFGIVLGTGLGGFTKNIKNRISIPYTEIPHFAVATALTHAGNLIIGKIHDKNVLALEGRLHLYEGYSAQEITYPIRIMQTFGVKHLFISNACGGINTQYSLGDIVFIEDHINLMGANPLVGAHDNRLGDRFPDMSEPYCQKLITLGRQVALQENILTQKGVYVGVMGPNLETRAEYRFLKTIGADIVGMSTVPEVIVANQAGMKVVGLSIVTDLCRPDALEPAVFAKIVAVAEQATPKLNKIINHMIQSIITKKM